MKFASWNVNGLRARLKDNFLEAFKELDADIFAVQDVRMIPGDTYIPIKDDYKQFWNSGERKRSGTMIFSRVEKKGFTRRDIGAEDFDIDGRTITLDLGEFYFVNVYIPNFTAKAWSDTQTRNDWETLFRKYLKKLDAVKPVIIAGSFMVAHKPIDLAHPDKNRNRMGYRDDDRKNFSSLLKSGFVDTFRELNPDLAGAYTWWSLRGNLREQNEGWRVDYFLTSERFIDRVSDATIESEIFGTEHCPITLTLD